MFKLTIIILAVCVYATHCAVIRPTEETKDLLETTTRAVDSTTTVEPEVTTINDEDITSTTTERAGGLSRDEEASVLIIDQTLLDPAPAELIKTNAETVQVERSGKLLLLSTPKIAEKPKIPEENLEESEEQDESVQSSTETVLETRTATLEETTTISTEAEDKTETRDELKIEANLKTKSQLDDIMTITEKTTKLYPINDTLYEDNKMNSIESAENSTLIVDEQPQELLNSNFGSVVLTESEADYFLVDTDVLEGSYADADSELHLQPIVQSVEIVPSSLDDQLLVNYVQSW